MRYRVRELLIRISLIGNIPWEIEPANDILFGATRFDRVLEEPDLGYRQDELGGLRSTIRKLAEHEVIDRMVARAMYDIQTQEDRHVFAHFARVILAGPPV